MSAAGTTAAAAFAKLMAKKTAVESTKNLVESQKTINDNQTSGAFDALKGAMQEMKGAAVNSLPFKLLLTEFNAGTMEARINLMMELMTLLQNPNVQTVIGGMIEVLVILINGSADLIALIDKFMSLMSAVPEYLERTAGDSTISPNNTPSDPTTASGFLDWLRDIWNSPFGTPGVPH